MTMCISPYVVQPAAIAPVGFAAAATGRLSLLPDAGSLSIDGINDAMSMIYALMSKQSRNDVDSGTASLKGRQGLRKTHEAEAKAARERQQKADGDGSRGFFSSIGHLLGDIVHNVTTLHVQDLLTDAKDDVVDAANSPKFWKDRCGSAQRSRTVGRRNVEGRRNIERREGNGSRASRESRQARSRRRT